MCILPAVFIKILVKLNINYIKDLYGDEINKKSKIEDEIKEEIKKRYR